MSDKIRFAVVEWTCGRCERRTMENSVTLCADVECLTDKHVVEVRCEHCSYKQRFLVEEDRRAAPLRVVSLPTGPEFH